MKRIFLFILIFVMTFLAMAVAMAPVGPIWSLVKDDVHNSVQGLQVLRTGGTLWNGDADVIYRSFPPSRLNWHISPWALLAGKITFIADASGEAHQLDANGSLTQSSTHIDNLSGMITSDYINRVSRNYGLTFTGDLNLEGIQLVADRKWLTSASGTATWPGGRIFYDNAENSQTINLPALKAELALVSENLVLDIQHEQARLILITLKPTGWTEIAIKARLFDLARIPWPGGSSLDDTVLQFEEKLF